jgi:hypothetical protein
MSFEGLTHASPETFSMLDNIHHFDTDTIKKQFPMVPADAKVIIERNYTMLL